MANLANCFASSRIMVQTVIYVERESDNYSSSDEDFELEKVPLNNFDSTKFIDSFYSHDTLEKAAFLHRH
jgi:hypothetical protein